MTMHGPAADTPEPSELPGQAEKRLEEDLLTQEHLESLAWLIWSDIETRIVHAVKAYNASWGARTTLHVAPRQMPYQMLIESNPTAQTLSVKLNTQTGVISFGNPALTSGDRLMIRIEGESSYRIEHYPSGESVNPGELANILLKDFLSLIGDSNK